MGPFVKRMSLIVRIVIDSMTQRPILRVLILLRHIFAVRYCHPVFHCGYCSTNGEPEVIS